MARFLAARNLSYLLRNPLGKFSRVSICWNIFRIILLFKYSIKSKFTKYFLLSNILWTIVIKDFGIKLEQDWSSLNFFVRFPCISSQVNLGSLGWLSLDESFVFDRKLRSKVLKEALLMLLLVWKHEQKMSANENYSTCGLVRLSMALLNL